jgi:hypothetical protein
MNTLEKLYTEIFNLLEKTKINVSSRGKPKRKTQKINKNYVGKGRSQTMGIVENINEKFKGKKGLDIYTLSKFTIDNPILYEKIKLLGKYYNFNFTSIQINKNFKCDRHKDSINMGESMIIGLGDYKGGELCIESIIQLEQDNEIKKINIKNKPYYFNGSQYFHWVNDFEGTRYTLVYFNIERYCKLKSLCKKCGEIENGDYCDCNEELTYEEKQKILMDNYDGGRCGWR